MNEAIEVLRDALKGTPFEHDAYLVGGFVRDQILGLEPSGDLDVVTTGDALECVSILVAKGVASSEPVVYPRFGTAMLRLAGTTVEFVSARSESYSPLSRKPVVERAGLMEDAQRRDFTVNTLMRRIDDGGLLDPLGSGLSDLEARVLRTPLEPGRTFFDDPLRMLRAVRFRGQLGFGYAQGLTEAIRENAARLQVVSAERIRDEFSKMLLLDSAADCLRDVMATGLADQFLPELRPMVGCGQSGAHHLDVWEHTLLALDHARGGDLTLKLSVLFHDVAKPATRSVEPNGRVRFLGHEVVGATITEAALSRLRYAGDQVAAVALLVRNHMRLTSMDELTAAAARRIVRDLDDHLETWLRLIEADVSALRPGERKLDLGPVRRRLEDVSRVTPASVLVSPLSGEDVMDVTGLTAGPEIGRIKRALNEAVLDGSLAVGDKDAARALVVRNWRNWANGPDIRQSQHGNGEPSS